MKKSLASALLLSLALLAALLALAGDDAKDVKLTGYITDQWCGAKNATGAYPQ